MAVFSRLIAFVSDSVGLYELPFLFIFNVTGTTLVNNYDILCFTKVNFVLTWLFVSLNIFIHSFIHSFSIHDWCLYEYSKSFRKFTT